MTKDFLLEIGCENLPSGYLDDVLDQVRSRFKEGLAADRIPYGELSVAGTPKRIVVLVRGLASKQQAAEEKVVGPPVKVAIAPDGSFTPAAQGFARTHGMSPGDLARVETPKGVYLAVVKKISGRPATAILKERIPAWVQSIRTPKTMRWDSGGMRFARPIRWILCLHGTSVVRVAVDRLAAGRITRPSPLFERGVPVKSVDDYFAVMRREGIILDPVERRKAVAERAAACARSLGGSLVEDEELVGIVANLLESPVVMAGRYDESFLALPREVIVTALKSHQRYFSVEGRDGKLLPCFVAFADGARRSPARIAHGYERVLRARLDDAVFYYREDTARPLAEMAAKLDRVVWLEGLGSLAAKAARIETLALWMRGAGAIGAGAREEDVRRAALLAKADLASEMVKDGKEFTALQGYIGREYARVSGEVPEVADAIYEHYLPRFAGDAVPARDVSVLVALADKIDTITGCFLMGLEPSGSQDPYALRRHAVGVLRILLARRAALSLPEACERSLAVYEQALGTLPRGRAEAVAAMREFYGQRLYTILRGEGSDHDLVAAILATPWDFPHAVRDMAAELGAMRARGELAPFVLAMKRVTNIIPKKMREGFARETGMRALEAFAEGREKDLGFSSTLFDAEAERELGRAVARASSALLEAKRSAMVERSLGILKELVPYVNKFFDDVLVNSEVEEIRNNRIAFLLSTYRVVMLFCEFSQIAGE